jgi:hypothetical protein
LTKCKRDTNKLIVKAVNNTDRRWSGMSAYLYEITSWPLQEDKHHLPEEEHVCGGLAVPCN